MSLSTQVHPLNNIGSIQVPYATYEVSRPSVDSGFEESYLYMGVVDLLAM